ncbi:MAG: nuclear transport factor 2 family protein [Hyphomicrobiaceae bacterium]
MTALAPAPAARDALFKSFGRAWFKRDVALLYEVVTPDFQWRFSDGSGKRALVDTREAVAAEFAAMGQRKSKLQFADVVYHHAPEATFMTFRAIESDPVTGAVLSEDVGIERYTFRDGRIAVKDVYRKRASAA